MKKINPFVLTTALANKIGDIISASILRDGNLQIRCVSEEQVQIKEIEKIKVESTRRAGKRNVGGCKGVITGVPISVGMEDFKRDVKEGVIINAQRLKRRTMNKY